MKEKIIRTLIAILLDMLSPEIIAKALNDMLDSLEDLIEKSETKYDDRVIIPILQMIRDLLD